jgi:hypothetical protein
MDPADFIRIMTEWREDFLRSAALPVVGATEAQLSSIEKPGCIVAGNDRVHTPQAARNIASLLPHCEFHDSVVARRPEDDLLEEWDQAEWKSKEGILADIYTDFMERMENRPAK